MSSIKLVAELRQDCGKGASRRLRRLNNIVPAIVYGGEKDAVALQFPHNKIIKALEDEHIYSSMLTLEVGSKKEHVILKALQRHPYKPVIMHMDFQRVSPNDEITKMVPVHFLNEEEAPGVKAGGIVNHHMNQIEVRCKVKNLPDHIDVDIAALEMNQVLHLSEVKLPKGVEFTVDLSDEHHNNAVVSIHMPRIEVEEPVVEEVAAEEGLEAAPEAGDAQEPSAE
jgi:large subunit ribosomal protein L25